MTYPRTPFFSQNPSGTGVMIYDAEQTTGNTFYVCSVTGTDSDGYGTGPDNPVATLDYAIGLCTASKGDRIIVMPGHAETYTTTGVKATIDVAGVQIIGLGQGSERPTFTFSHTGATWTLSANGVLLQNMLFVTGVDSVTTYCTISGADATLIDIEGRDTTDIEVINDFTVTGDRLNVQNYYKNGYTGGNANARVFSMNGVDGAIFDGCRFITKVTTAVINFVTAACTGVAVKNTVFYVNGTTDFSKNVVDTVTGSTWIVTDGFDVGSGGQFGGGSGNALAADDISAVTDALYGANGIATFPASAAPTNNVSLAEVLRSIYDRQLGDGTNAATSYLGKRVSRTTADVFAGAPVPIFTISGGRVLVTQIVGEVTTIIGAGINNFKLQSNPTTGTTTDLCANLDIDADEVGTLYSITGLPTDALQRGESGGVRGMVASGVVVPIGQIEAASAGNVTGSAKFDIWYIPLDDGASIAAA